MISKVGAACAVVLVAALAMACGDNGEGGNSSATEGPTPMLQGIDREFQNAVAEAYQATFTVRYEVTGGASDESLVAYNSPPNSRIDRIPAGSDEAVSVLIGAGADEQAITCAREGEDWDCSEIDSLGDSVLSSAGPIVFLEPADIVMYTVTEAADRTIAGQTARCFQLEPKTDDVEGLEYCFAENGAPLYSAPLFGTVEATEFSAEVANDAFVPPNESKPAA